MKKRSIGGRGTLLILLAVADALLLVLLIALYTVGGMQSTLARDALARRFETESGQEEQTRLERLSAVLNGVSYSPASVLEPDGIALFLCNAQDSGGLVSVEVTRLETGERLGLSGLIEPGYRLEYLPCGAQPPRGEHMCLLTLRVYAPDGTYLGEAGRNLLLTVR